MTCFWQDFANCHEECAADDCGTAFVGAEVYAFGTGRSEPADFGTFGFAEGGGEALILDFTELGGASFATIRSGVAKTPTAECDNGCCLLVGGSTGVPPDYDFDSDPDFDTAYFAIGELEMAPVDGEPNKFVIPLVDLFIDIDAAPMGGMVSINVETNTGMFCDIRATLEYCH